MLTHKTERDSILGELRKLRRKMRRNPRLIAHVEALFWRLRKLERAARISTPFLHRQPSRIFPLARFLDQQFEARGARGRAHAHLMKFP